MYGLVLFYFFSSINCYEIPDADLNGVHYNFSDLKPLNDGPIPLIWDWREKNAVSPVKDQRSCNACWAFSAIANIESLIMIYYREVRLLSEQFLIDCDGSGVGCGSTSVLKAFGQIVNKLGGVLQYKDYTPYQDTQRPCFSKGNPKPIPVTGYKRVRSNELDMLMAVFKHGPLSAGINSASMKTYSGGIDQPDDQECSSKTLDHAVLIVGFNVYVNTNTGETVPYWIIKNSWGSKWGDHGFYYLERGRNACGIANDVSFAMIN